MNKIKNILKQIEIKVEFEVVVVGVDGVMLELIKLKFVEKKRANEPFGLWEKFSEDASRVFQAFYDETEFEPLRWIQRRNLG